MPKRDLTVADIGAVMALQAEQPERATYKAVERLAKETCGWRLLTILKYVEKDAVVERVSSSDEQASCLQTMGKSANRLLSSR